MPIPSGFTIVPGPCLGGAAVEYVTGLFGPPAPGKRYTCSPLPRIGPLVLSSLVREVDLLAGTYLVQTVHNRTAGQDTAVTTFHYRWADSGDPASTDFAAVESRLNGFWTALKAYRTSLVTGGEHRWYGPRDAPGAWGEAIRVTPVTTPLIGTASGGLPQQVACSVTEVTDIRRRWGRFYIPCLALTDIPSTEAAGTFSSAFVAAVAAAADVAFNQNVANWKLVVFGAPLPTSLEVRRIRVDTVPDVIRRRRWDGGTTTEVDVTS